MSCLAVLPPRVKLLLAVLAASDDGCRPRTFSIAKTSLHVDDIISVYVYVYVYVYVNVLKVTYGCHGNTVDISRSFLKQLPGVVPTDRGNHLQELTFSS